MKQKKVEFNPRSSNVGLPMKLNQDYVLKDVADSSGVFRGDVEATYVQRTCRGEEPELTFWHSRGNTHHGIVLLESDVRSIQGKVVVARPGAVYLSYEIGGVRK